jgi:PDDEXK-like domain of unknown function (DUF3799)
MAFTDNPETKLVPNLPFADYVKAHGVSQSRLRIFDYDLGGCPALYKWSVEHPDQSLKDTKALSDGRRYHHFILEPDSFLRFYALRTKEIEQELFEKAKVDPKCKARGFSPLLGTVKKWTADREAEGKLVITQDDSDVLHEMRQALMLNNEVFDELGACRSDQLELSAFAGFEFKRGTHEGKYMQLKARFDIVPDGKSLIDLKTARTSHQQQFALQAYRLGYHIQAAFYTDCANANGLKKTRFGFLSQDKFPPYLSCIHWVEGWIGRGRQRYTDILRGLADAITRNEWSGYHSGELMPPNFAEAEFEAVGTAELTHGHE